MKTEVFQFLIWKFHASNTYRSGNCSEYKNLQKNKKKPQRDIFNIAIIWQDIM